MDKILSLIAKGESQTVEFKTSFQKEYKRHGSVEVSFAEFQHGFRIVLTKIGKTINIGVNVIYDFIVRNQPVKANIIANNFKEVTQRTIERYIKQLKNENKIAFKGAPKTGGYVVNQKPKTKNQKPNAK